MDSFKLALKSALAEKADALCLKLGQKPVVFSNGQVRELTGHDKTEEPELKALISTLLPEVKIQPNKPHRGEVSIVNFGDIDIIGSLADPAELWSFFRPQGSTYLNQAWEQLKSRYRKEEAVIQQSVHPSSSGIDESSERFSLKEPEVSSGIANDHLESGGSESEYSYLQYQPEVSSEHHSPSKSTKALNEDVDLNNMFDVPAQDSTLSHEVESKIEFGHELVGHSIESGVKDIDRLLGIMVQRGASDLHLTQMEPPCIRVDGMIHRLDEKPLDAQSMKSYILPIMSEAKESEFIELHDTDFSYAVSGLGRFRVNVFRGIYGVGAVFRQIPESVLTADQIGLSTAIRSLCQLSKGLVLVTGPTGSGKSTTLAAMIDLINQQRREHIVTIEDPIEFVHHPKQCLINQREVYTHTKSFYTALKAALREDPDIVMVGEMRDLETVAAALEIAETGHLVFGTLHTNTAASTVDRLVDQFPADRQSQVRVMLSETLKGVISQVLLPKNEGGRCTAQEILIVDRAVSSMIREGNSHMIHNHMQTQKKMGNVLMNESLLDLVQQDLTSIEVAYSKSIDKEAFVQLAQSRRISLQGLAS